MSESITVVDRLQRPLRDLRISVTDRCNFRCVYCMPKEIFGPDFTFLPSSALLSFEGTPRAARVFADPAVRKTRPTGGGPLGRRDTGRLISLLPKIAGLD